MSLPCSARRNPSRQRSATTPTTKSAQEFVFELGSRTDEYQDAESEGDFALLLKLCDILAQDSRELGYAVLERLALRVCSACEDGGPDTGHKAKLDLTAAVNRVHRGPA